MLRARALTAEADGMAAMAESHIARWFPEAFRCKRPEVLDRIRKTLIRQDRTFHARLWDMVATLDMEAQISAVTVPTLVIVGADDPSAPLAAGQLIAHQIGDDAKVAVLPDCGHFPPIEFPESFNALLRDFLAMH
jgi:3-oxoadipate enol-lactonase